MANQCGHFFSRGILPGTISQSLLNVEGMRTPKISGMIPGARSALLRDRSRSGKTASKLARHSQHQVTMARRMVVACREEVEAVMRVGREALSP
jgi:hypothetical protein